MDKNWARIITIYILKNRMLILLAATFILIISFPLIQDHYSNFLLLIELLFNVSLVGGIYLVSKNKQIVTVAFLISIMAIVVIWFDMLLNSRALLIFGLCAETLFCILATIVIIRHVVHYKKVTEDKIYGSISAYLLIGIFWALIYTIIELSDPNSFFFAHGFILNQQQLSPHRFYFSQFLYSSFVTLSTLGYGDIVPVSGPARVFSSLEAVTGQLYVATLIARLVGIHISHKYDRAINK